MPQNMQKKPKVSSLELDEMPQIDDSTSERGAYLDVGTIAEADDRYQAALGLLKHGYAPKKIAIKLVEIEAMPNRQSAMRLALRVSKENPDEQRVNAIIQLGVGAVTALIALAFIVPPIINTGIWSFSPAYMLFIVSAWFFYKGLTTIRGSRAKR